MTRVDHRRTDTRDRILSVALRLFVEQGYANTSLREIAENLGVTKAALYFHYKTKEDIISAILRGWLDGLEALLDQAELTPPGREDLLRRYAEHQAAWGRELTELVRQNHTEILGLPIGADMRAAQIRLVNALAGPDPSVLDYTRAITAISTVQHINAAVKLGIADDKEARAAALVVALEVLRAGSPSR